MTMDVSRLLTTYTGPGGNHEAIQLPWDLVDAITEASDTPEGGDAIREALMGAGAPEWVRSAEEGWIDERGWGLIGPRAEPDPED